MDHQLWGDDGGGKGVHLGFHGWEGGYGAVGDGVGERAEADHAEELEAVVFED